MPALTNDKGSAYCLTPGCDRRVDNSSGFCVKCRSFTCQRCGIVTFKKGSVNFTRKHCAKCATSMRR